MQITKFIRKPLTVDAVQVTEADMAEIAEWANGKLHTDVLDPKEWFIEIKVIHRLRRKESQAHVGDWILKSKQGHKIYSDRAFKKGFEPAFEDPEVKNPLQTAENMIQNGTCVCGDPLIDNSVHSKDFPCYMKEPAFDDQGAIYAPTNALGFQ